MDESLDACRREVGRLQVLLTAAHEEIDFIRDRGVGGPKVGLMQVPGAGAHESEAPR